MCHYLQQINKLVCNHVYSITSPYFVLTGPVDSSGLGTERQTEREMQSTKSQRLLLIILCPALTCMNFIFNHEHHFHHKKLHISKNVPVYEAWGLVRSRVIHCTHPLAAICPGLFQFLVATRDLSISEFPSVSLYNCPVTTPLRTRAQGGERWKKQKKESK